MAIKRTLDREAITRFTDISPSALKEKTEGGIYHDTFPIKFARELIKEIWRAQHIPEVKTPRLKMRDGYAALSMSYSALRKYLASGELGRVHYDVAGNVLLSLEQFFAAAAKIGEREWLPDGYVVRRVE